MSGKSYCDCGRLTTNLHDDGMVICHQCAEIETLRNDNAKMKSQLEKLRGHDHITVPREQWTDLMDDNIRLTTQLNAEREKVRRLREVLDKEKRCLQSELHSDDGICPTMTHQQRYGMMNTAIKETEDK